MPKTLLSNDDAAAISLRALAFLAETPERIAAFLDLTEAEPAALPKLAPQTYFQVAVLNHLLGEESMVLEFCANESIDPALPAMALEILERPRR